MTGGWHNATHRGIFMEWEAEVGVPKIQLMNGGGQDMRGGRCSHRHVSFAVKAAKT